MGDGADGADGGEEEEEDGGDAASADVGVFDVTAAAPDSPFSPCSRSSPLPLSDSWQRSLAGDAPVLIHFSAASSSCTLPLRLSASGVANTGCAASAELTSPQ